MHLLKQILCAAALILFVFGSFNSHAKLPAGVSVSISPVKQSYSANDAILLKVRYTNTTSRPITFLKWGTAAEGRVDEDFLEITGAQGRYRYTGRVYKRAAPTTADFLTLAAGQSKEYVVDVTQGYALENQGNYQITYAVTEGSGLQPNATATLQLSEARAVIAYKQAPTTESCVGNRPALIDSALSAAESISRFARDDLSRTPPGLRSSASRYIEWFGSYTSGRWNQVQNNFNRIYAALSGQTLHFICDDTTSAFAYVFSNRPYEIYLGQAFWSAPGTGTDSKAGTIVHEVSHFSVVADTDDHVYGQSGARSLAIFNPNNAVRNADSHEYFAENTPFLSMPSAADLVVNSRQFSSPEIRTGRAASVSGDISNLGDSESGASSVSLSLVNPSADSQSFQTPIPSVSARSSTNFTIDFTAPETAGTYTATVCVTATAAESNTANNCGSPVQLIVEKNSTSIIPVLDLLLEEE